MLGASRRVIMEAMRFQVLALALVGVGLATQVARGDASRASLGSYERQALERALAARDLEIEPAPEGKTVRRIHVVNHDVFAADEGVFNWFNALHRTTRADIIEREVFLQPGEPWDPRIVEDNVRRLRDPTFSNVVVMMPVKAPEPGTVDVLVVTRDIWSLRLNSDYEIQNGDLTRLVLAPAETNLLGLRKQLAFFFVLDQGAYSLGPYYHDSNIAGSRLRLDAQSVVVFSRDQGRLEGTRSEVALTYPLWSLRRRWGGNVTFTHLDDIRRDFLGTALRPRDLQATPDVQEAVPFIYDRRSTSLDASVTRAFGQGIKRYVTFGHELFINRPGLHQGGPSAEQCAGTPVDVCRRLFQEEMLPRSERTSALYAELSVFTTDFRTYRNVDTYDLPEERQLGPDVRVGAAVASRALGSEQGFLRVFAQVGWTFRLGADGFVRTLAFGETRYQGQDFIENEAMASVVAVSPVLAGALRLIGRAEVAAYRDDNDNRYYTLGGDSGLRGYLVGAFDGEKRARGNLEVRTLPTQVWFTRVGLLGFWDLGHAADRFAELRVQHDVGLGIRAVIPQLQTAALRLDWAVPLTGSTAGLPGRFILGFEQAVDALGTSPVPDA